LVGCVPAAVLSVMTFLTDSPTPTSSTESKAVVQRYLAAVQAGDEAAIRELFAPAATWLLRGELPNSGLWEGRDAILGEFLATALGFYAPGSVQLEQTGLLAEGDQVVLEWISRARTRTGEPYENFCIAVFTVRDGRIQAVREYMDTLYAHRVAFSA
jgi:ketosteroid isomerase-like protein